MKKDLGVSILKIISMIFVVLIHVTADNVVNYKGMVGQEWDIYNMLNTISRVAVPTFIMLSGYCLLNKDEPHKVFYKKRFVKIIPSFIIWNCVYIYLIKYYFEAKDTIEDLSLKTFREPIYYHLWFIYMIVGLYLITPFLRKIIKSVEPKYTKAFLYINFAMVFLNTYLVIFFNLKLNLYIYVGVELLYFVFGAYVYDYMKSFKYIYLNIIGLVAVNIIMVTGNKILTIESGKFEGTFNGYNSILNFIQTLLFIVIFLKIGTFLDKYIYNWIKKIIYLLDDCVMNVFFVHPIVILFVTQWLKANGIINNLNNLPLIMALVLLISIIISAILNINLSLKPKKLEKV